MLSRHKRMLLRPSYGRIGCVAMPYMVIFELLGPTIECFGYTLFIVSLCLGFVSVWFAVAFFAVSLIYGLVLSFLVILMEERAFRRYPDWTDLVRMTVCAVIENVGYRQLLAVVRMRSWYTLLRGKQGWREMKRKGFGDLVPAAAEVIAIPRRDPTADPVLAGEIGL
jgi:hypothetical protein